MTQSIHIIHTPCKECAFAIYNDKTQTDCALNYLSAYKDMDPNCILEVYDEQKEFFVINDKKCVGYRENKWFDQFESDLSIEDKKKIFFESNTLNYVVTINLNDININDLEDTLTQIKNLTVLPEKLIFVRYPQDKSEHDYSYPILMKCLKNSNLDIMWTIQTVVDDINYKQFLANIVFTNKKYRFILSIKEYNQDITNIIDAANDIIYHKLGRFNVLSNKNKNAIMFPSAVYRYYMTNEEKNLLDNEELYSYI